MPRFTREPIPSPNGGPDFPAALQGWLNFLLNAVNTLADETALDRFYLFGVGRLQGQGCRLARAGGALRLGDGWFQAGPGIADVEDAAYFRGARLVEVRGAGAAGYIELSGAETPPLNKPDGVFGYMSAYGDVLWLDAKPAIRPDGRWCIGEVVTDGAGVASFDDATGVADEVPNLQNLLAQLAALNTRLGLVEGGGGEGGGGFSYVGPAPWLPAPEDSRPTATVIGEMLSTLAAQLRGEMQNSGQNPFPTPFDIISNTVAKCVIANAETDPHSIERQELAAIGQGFGRGQDDTPNFDLGGTLTWNEATGFYEP